MTLQIFDFDETLFRIPNYTVKEATGMTPYEWYDSPLSLSDEFNIHQIDNLINIIKDSGDSTINYIISQRSINCRNKIIEILQKIGIYDKIDTIETLGREYDKTGTFSILMQYVDINAEFDSIIIYEDSVWEILKYVRFFKEIEVIPTNLIFKLVSSSKILTIPFDKVSEIESSIIDERIKVSKI